MTNEKISKNAQLTEERLTPENYEAHIISLSKSFKIMSSELRILLPYSEYEHWKLSAFKQASQSIMVRGAG